MTHARRTVPVLLASLLLPACAGCTSGSQAAGEPPVQTTHPAKAIFFTELGEVTVDLEVVETKQSRARGLMFRTSLGPSQGMLFIFPQQAIQSFWMKNTFIPLDMIFIDQQLRVVGVVAKAKPETLESRKVDRPSRYVVEVNGGFAAKAGIRRGTLAKFEGTKL